MELIVAGLSANYGGENVLRSIDVRIPADQLLSVLGPSGSGKSTLLRALAGLQPPFVTGDIRFGNRSIIGDAPKDRRVGFVFQDLALYPHLRVFDNIALPLRFAGHNVSKAEIAIRVNDVATKLGISEYLGRYPKQLSGGQQQRAAIARAIIRRPDLRLLLLDEPFSGLDPTLRASTRQLLRSIHREMAITMICVTHDRADALAISDRILILRDGRVQQFDTPEGLLDRPANRFTATFINDGGMNYYVGAVDRSSDSPMLRFAGVAVPLTLEEANRLESASLGNVGIRPSSFRTTHECNHASPHAHGFPIALHRIEVLGDRILIEGSMPDGNSPVRILTSRGNQMQASTCVCVCLQDVLFFDSADESINL